MDSFFEEKIKTDAQVLQLAKKVTETVDQEPIAKNLTAYLVCIKTRDSKEYSQRVAILRWRT